MISPQSFLKDFEKKSRLLHCTSLLPGSTCRFPFLLPSPPQHHPGFRTDSRITGMGRRSFTAPLGKQSWGWIKSSLKTCRKVTEDLLLYLPWSPPKRWLPKRSLKWILGEPEWYIESKQHSDPNGIPPDLHKPEMRRVPTSTTWRRFITSMMQISSQFDLRPASMHHYWN